ncbi:MAG: hypothetical protein RR775_22530 [Massilia sp.]
MRAKDLKEQADATRAAASELSDPKAKAAVNQGADTLAALARHQAHTNRPGHIFELPDTATSFDLKAHRCLRAIRHGDDVYLPNGHDLAVLFPNILLRSSLFSASNPGALLDRHTLGTPKNVSLEMDGPQLGYYDRRVFGACLGHYQAEHPLASNEATHWISTTVWQLAEKIGTYNHNSPSAICDSLKRLEAVTLRIRTRLYEFPVHHLIEVAFDDTFTLVEAKEEQVKGAGRVRFRIQESMAALYGLNQWTAVSNRSLHDHEGLAAWICTFYASHKEPFEYSVSHFYSLTGAKGTLAEFRKRLRSALTKLQATKNADEHRVADFEMTKNTITVTLARWR